MSPSSVGANRVTRHQLVQCQAHITLCPLQLVIDVCAFMSVHRTDDTFTFHVFTFVRLRRGFHGGNELLEARERTTSTRRAGRSGRQKERNHFVRSSTGDALASSAMMHWDTFPFNFQVFNFSGYFAAAHSTPCDGCLSCKNL